MGRTNKKVHLVICLLSLLGCFLLLPENLTGFDDATDVQVAVKDFKFPHRKEDGTLQLIIYGKNVKNSGILIILKELLIDCVKSKIEHVKSIRDFKGIKLYDLNESNANIEKFWKDKLHTQAFISSKSAVINRRNEVITGEEKIIFRSPFMDIDGVGYDFDYPNQKIHIRSNVKVNLRTDNINEMENAGSLMSKDKDK